MQKGSHEQDACCTLMLTGGEGRHFLLVDAISQYSKWREGDSLKYVGHTQGQTACRQVYSRTSMKPLRPGPLGLCRSLGRVHLLADHLQLMDPCLPFLGPWLARDPALLMRLCSQARTQPFEHLPLRALRHDLQHHLAGHLD